MSDVREQMSAAKKRIEVAAGVEFRRETIALADLISEFVVLKMGGSEKPEQQQSFVTSKPGAPKDSFYGD